MRVEFGVGYGGIFFFKSLLSVEYSPVLALGVVLQLALDHVDHDLVADETTLIHDLLSLLAEVGLLRDLGPQHVTGGLLRSHCVR